MIVNERILIKMSLKNAIIGGLLFGTNGFIAGALIGNDRNEKVTVNVNPMVNDKPIIKEPTIEDDFYDKLADKNFEALVNEYCWDMRITLDDLNKHAMESLLFEYDEMIEKGWI